MKRLITLFGIMMVLLVVGCQKDELFDSKKEKFNESTSATLRSLKDEYKKQFFDKNFVSNSIKLEINKTINKELGYFITHYVDKRNLDKYLPIFEKQDIYPCWDCAESEGTGLMSFYVPLVDLSSREVKGILIARQDKYFTTLYLQSTLIRALYGAYPDNANYGYWVGIQSFFQGKLNGDNPDRDDFFATTRTPCTFYPGAPNDFGSCVCGGEGSCWTTNMNHPNKEAYRNDCEGSECTEISGVATCSDGIQNQGELGVDCGGPCAPCAGSGGASRDETGEPPYAPDPTSVGEVGTCLICSGTGGPDSDGGSGGSDGDPDNDHASYDFLAFQAYAIALTTCGFEPDHFLNLLNASTFFACETSLGICECAEENEPLTQEELCSQAVSSFLDTYNITSTVGVNYALRNIDGCGVDMSQGEFNREALSLDIIKNSWLNDHPLHQNQRNNFLNNHPNDPKAIEFADEHLLQLMVDQEYADFVEASLGFSPVMWAIAKELIGDKVIDILVRFIPIGGQSENIKDAVKAISHGDWLEFGYEVIQITFQNSPIGQYLRVAESANDLRILYNKINRIWNKIGTFSEAAVNQMWTIVKRYPKALWTNADLMSGIAKAIHRGIKSIDEVVASIPEFTQMSNQIMRHILHGDAGGGLHHASGLVNNPTLEVIEHFAPNAKGVYKVRYKLPNGQTKLSTMFPDNKSEIGVAKSIEKVFNDNITMPYTKQGFPGRRWIGGKDAGGLDIEIEIDISNNIITGYPVFN